MNLKKFFGVDIGGTAVKWAVITEAFEIVKKGEFPTPYENADVLAGQITAVFQQQQETFSGIGVSVPGTLRDEPDGVVEGGGCLRYLDGIPLGKMLRERTGCRCFVENDGKSCALGEYTSGALKDCRVGVVLVLGTGVGGGIVIDGKVFKGSHAFAGEFSYLLERPGGSLRFEDMLGKSCGWKAGMLAELLNRKGLPADTPMNGHDIFRLIHEGDEDAAAALKKFTRHLATQIHNLQAVLDPDVFAVGGGISNQPVLIEQLVKDVEQIYESTDFKQFPKPHIVHCEHGSNANLLGAVYLCRQRMEN